MIESTLNVLKFITTSAGAADSGKLPRLNGSGQLDSSFVTAALATVTLQQAYQNGNTINTTVGEGTFGVSGTQQISLSTSSALANGIDLINNTGGINVDAVTGVTINTSGANDDITISADGTGTSQLILQSGGTGANAIRMVVSGTSGGGIDVDAATGSGVSPGGNITINGGQGGATAAGGNVSVTSGAGGGTSGVSGNVTVASGATTDGNSGNVTIQTANATGTNRSGGDIICIGGTGTGTGRRGGFLLRQVSEINTTAGDAATINAVAGRFRKDTSGAAFTLTNSFINANSIVMVAFANAAIDATATSMTVAAAGGSATITFNAAPTANCDVNFWVISND